MSRVSRIAADVVALSFVLATSTCSNAMAGPPTALGHLLVLPYAVPAKQPVSVLVKVRIEDASLIPGSVYLHRLDAEGRPGPRIAVFADDGREPDRVAGDGELTVRFTVDEPSQVRFEIAASAGFRGSLKRVFSRPARIETSDAISSVSGPKASLFPGEQTLVFMTESGSPETTLSLASVREGTDPSRQLETTWFATVSPSQSAAGVFGWTDAVPVGDDEHDGQILASRFALYAGDGTKLWDQVAPAGSYFDPPADPHAMFSDSGDRVLLVLQGGDDQASGYTIFARDGAVLYRSAEQLLAVIASRMSPDGQRAGVVATRPDGDSFDIVFQVVDVSSGNKWELVLRTDLGVAFAIEPTGGGAISLFINGQVVSTLP